MGSGKLPNNRRKKCENNGRPLQVSFIYWCRLALKAMNPVVLSSGYMLILIYSICATKRWSSIVGCSKKCAVWIWSIRLSSFYFCVAVLFGPEKKKKKLHCLKNTCKEQSIRLRAWSGVRVWQSDSISPLLLTKAYGICYVYIFTVMLTTPNCIYQ